MHLHEHESITFFLVYFFFFFSYFTTTYMQATRWVMAFLVYIKKSRLDLPIGSEKNQAHLLPTI